MTARQTRTRFQARTETERLFITPVNAVFGGKAPLAGMTAAGIEAWVRVAKPAFPAKPVEEVARVLLEASNRASLLSDDSRDVFREEDLQKVDSLDELHRMLLKLM